MDGGKVVSAVSACIGNMQKAWTGGSVDRSWSAQSGQPRAVQSGLPFHPPNTVPVTGHLTRGTSSIAVQQHSGPPSEQAQQSLVECGNMAEKTVTADQAPFFSLVLRPPQKQESLPRAGPAGF